MAGKHSDISDFNIIEISPISYVNVLHLNEM